MTFVKLFLIMFIILRPAKHINLLLFHSKTCVVDLKISGILSTVTK